MSYILSPAMSLPIPGVGSESGPNYALDVNSCLSLLDAHDHSSGRGVQVTPSGLNINANLAFNTNYIQSLGAATFSAQSAPLVALQTLYVAPGTESPPVQDLWYTDSSGTAIQLTAGGVVNATIGSLPGENYSAGTFFWKQGSGSTTPANFDIGSITLRPNVASTAYGVILGPPVSIASQYNIALPLLPASARVLSIDNSGNMATDVTGTVQTLDIADQNVTQSKLAPRPIGPTVAAGGVARNNFFGTQNITTTGGSATHLTNMDVTITTTGRPIMLMMISGDNSGGSGYFQISSTGFQNPSAASGFAYIQNTTVNSTIATATFDITSNAVVVSTSASTTDPTWNDSAGLYNRTTNTSTTTNSTVTFATTHQWPMSFMGIDYQPAGTYSYSAYALLTSAFSTFSIVNARIVAYEL